MVVLLRYSCPSEKGPRRNGDCGSCPAEWRFPAGDPACTRREPLHAAEVLSGCWCPIRPMRARHNAPIDLRPERSPRANGTRQPPPRPGPLERSSHRREVRHREEAGLHERRDTRRTWLRRGPSEDRQSCKARWARCRGSYRPAPAPARRARWSVTRTCGRVHQRLRGLDLTLPSQLPRGSERAEERQGAASPSPECALNAAHGLLSLLHPAVPPTWPNHGKLGVAGSNPVRRSVRRASFREVAGARPFVLGCIRRS